MCSWVLCQNVCVFTTVHLVVLLLIFTHYEGNAEFCLTEFTQRLSLSSLSTERPWEDGVTGGQSDRQRDCLQHHPSEAHHGHYVPLRPHPPPLLPLSLTCPSHHHLFLLSSRPTYQPLKSTYQSDCSGQAFISSQRAQ